jgi:hypothetical protein
MDDETVVVMKKIKFSTLDTRELLKADKSSALSQEVQKLFLQQATNLQNRILFSFFIVAKCQKCNCSYLL